MVQSQQVKTKMARHILGKVHKLQQHQTTRAGIKISSEKRWIKRLMIIRKHKGFA
jgi:hypothetical protein